MQRVILAEYFVTDEGTLLLGARADWSAPRVAEIPLPRAELRDRLAGLFGEKTSSAHLRNAEPSWQEELSDLIAPLAGWADPGDGLCLVPHDALHAVPLHALLLDGRPLVERHPVCYSPSASVLKYCQARRKGRRRNALVLGDPRGDLVHARLEAIQVARRFGGTALLGREAGKARLLEELAARGEDIDVVHLACHGSFDPVEPLRSGLFLAPEGNDTGLLTAEELFGLEMRVDLVTLSACETAARKVRPGDELFGLVRSVLYAGTPSVLMNLWVVDDIAASLFIERFYDELGRPGVTKVEALQTAQLAVADTTAAEAIAHCETLLALLPPEEEKPRRALRRDLAYLWFQARSFAEARDLYEDLAAGAVNAAERQAFGLAVVRCELALQEGLAPQPELRVYGHPFFWAPFILVGDWQ